jgi:sugar phosphate permease
MDGIWGFSGWQWCFIAEGVPCVILGVINFVILYDKPEQAKWLSPREKRILMLSLEAERQADRADKAHALPDKWWQALRDPKIYLMAFLIISCQGSAMVNSFWLPTIIKGLGVKSLANVGYLGIIPYAAAVVGLLLITRSSDRHAERRWHFAISVFAVAAALVLAPQFSKSLSWSLVMLAVLAIGTNSAIPTFWAIPARYLGPAAAAGGLALLSSLAALGNFLSPIVMGYLVARTGSIASGMYVHAAAMFLAGLAMLLLVPERAVRVGAQQPAAKKAGA